MSQSYLKFIIASAALVLCAGCEKEQHTSNQARFYENGRAKPIVALVPVIDNSQSDISWNLSDEFTSSVHYRLMQKDRLYLVDVEKVRATTKKLKEFHNPFDIDLSWIKKAFFENEFVIFMELFSHEEVPVSSKEATSHKDAPLELMMKMRVRVIDLQGEEPKIALQEIISNSHYIPKQFNRDHFTQVEWGNENYNISPLGVAHAQMAKEIASHLEDYILLSTQRNTLNE
jgi:hypothetical protein